DGRVGDVEDRPARLVVPMGFEEIDHEAAGEPIDIVADRSAQHQWKPPERPALGWVGAGKPGEVVADEDYRPDGDDVEQGASNLLGKISEQPPGRPRILGVSDAEKILGEGVAAPGAVMHSVRPFGRRI